MEACCACILQAHYHDEATYPLGLWVFSEGSRTGMEWFFKMMGASNSLTRLYAEDDMEIEDTRQWNEQ